MSVAPAALLLDTLRLGDTADRERLSAAWHAVDSTGLGDLLEYEGAALWLYRRLTDLGMLALPDPTFATELTMHARRITAYNLMVDAQRDAVIRMLGDAHIPHVLLKGCALRLARPRIPYGDARLIADVDVLVPPNSVERARDRLHEAGFTVAGGDQEKFEAHHHLPPVTDGRGIMVELHRSTSPRTLPDDAWSRMTAGAANVPHAGATTLLPAPTELLWHAVTHVESHTPDGFRLRFFLDAAAIISVEESIDWNTIRNRLDTGELEDPALAVRFLGAAHWLAGGPRPPNWLRSSHELDLRRTLTWRGTVLTALARYRMRRGSANGAPHALVRTSRLLMEEGIRAELKLSPTPPKFGRTRAARVGRRIAARAARLLYFAWRTLGPQSTA
jgi:hypothetical protein